MAVTWTKEQQKVIDLRNRNILVSAAAGSGKTAVLVERIITMITDQANPVDIDQVLVVTFTKAAASEMKERIALALEKQKELHPDDENLEKQIALLPSAQITTIHSFCLHVIRNYFNEIDIDPSFRIGEEIELNLLKSDIMEALLEEKYEEANEEFLSFVECYARGKTDQTIEGLILELYEYSQSYPWPKKWLRQCLSNLSGTKEDFEKTQIMDFLMRHIKSVLEDAMNYSQKAMKLCERPDGPIAYQQAVHSDILFIKGALKADTFSQMYEQFQKLKWEALSRKKMPDALECHKDTVKFLREQVKTMVNELKERFFFQSLEGMFSDILVTKKYMEVLVDLVEAFLDRFQASKAEKNMLDFGDLEHFALNILMKQTDDDTYIRTDSAKELSSHFKEVLCDEYQDSNFVQETILKAVSTEEDGHPNIFMVGDVKQSIYKFRQARPELFMEKYASYDTEDALYQRIDLHKNFRSRSCVVDFVNLIFKHIMGESLGGITYNDDAALYCGASFPEATDEKIGKDTEVILVDLKYTDSTQYPQGAKSKQNEYVTDKVLEAKVIGEKIKVLMKDNYQVVDKATGQYRKVEYKDIVILLRTMRGWTDVFTETLMDMGIPVHSEATSGFFDTLEIRTAISILSVIDNPLQDIPLAATMKSCIGQFSDEELSMIHSILPKSLLYDACVAFLDESSDLKLHTWFEPEVCEKVRQKLNVFMEVLHRYAKFASYMGIYDLICMLFEETGYMDYMSALPAGKKRLANLELFLEKAIAYERTSYKGLFNFVRYISRLKSQNVELGEASVVGDAEDVVRIISIHKSKGLEYPIVFVSGMSKAFNMQDTRGSILMHADYGLGPEAVNEQLRVVTPTLLKHIIALSIQLETLSEELRVLYVALTRAKEKLILTATVNDVEQKMTKWKEIAKQSGPQLPFSALAMAKNYLDWIMPVLCNEAYMMETNAIVHTATKYFFELVTKDLLEETSMAAAKEALDTILETNQISEAVNQWTNDHLLWKYPFEDAMGIPAKMSVSDIKKMYLEEEEDLVVPVVKSDADEHIGADEFVDADQRIEDEEDTPLTKEERMKKAATRGTAVHKMMEILDYDKVSSYQEIKEQIQNAKKQGHFTEETAQMINPWKIWIFIQSNLGQRMKCAAQSGKLHREQQYMMLVNADDIFKEHINIQDEYVLTQGIIDAWFEEEDGIVLVDYKTDYVPENGEDILIKRYKTQLDFYEKALEKMLHQQVTQKMIYAFSLDLEIEVE